MYEYETPRFVKVHNTCPKVGRSQNVYLPAALLSNHQLTLQEQPGHDHHLHSGLGLGAWEGVPGGLLSGVKCHHQGEGNHQLKPGERDSFNTEYTVGLATKYSKLSCELIQTSYVSCLVGYQAHVLATYACRLIWENKMLRLIGFKWLDSHVLDTCFLRLKTPVLLRGLLIWSIILRIK